MRIIIVGAGEVGFHISRRLAVENKEVIVIDRSADALKRVAEATDVKTIKGSGSSPGVLQEAGVKGADILLAVTDSDEINILSCYFANQLSKDITKLARIRHRDYTDYANLVREGAIGIKKIINPDQEVVDSILRLMSVPGAVEINEFAQGKIRLIGVNLPPDSPVIGTKLLNLRDRIGDVPVVIAAIVRDDELIIPSGVDEIRKGDVVYFACDIRDQDDIIDRLGIKYEPIKKVMIVGGGNIGYQLAKALDNKHFHTRLLDNDPERCQYLSEQLDRPIILQGDGTDQEVLREENIGDMDMVIAVTGDEETNILTCLLAKSLGARSTTTRINNFAYMPLIDPIGIDHLVCPRLSAINSLLHFIRRGQVISTASIKADEAEVLEAIAQEKSDVVGKPIMELDFPRGSLVLCFQRGHDVIIPRGDTVIEPGDRLVILSARNNISKVEKALDAKMEFI
ncbi:Trk system potassium transporter TrkA [Salidesulfovibrio brasiliensis]|uniref:Trk system potassium transporter TrkA n=1 Tax=Salidesulfovibrio brasiliensis TaxID=221711 RepID=UPI0006D0A169|nr:Trk system potassium transporter TrkA [Salidesulfovibrio brasiliensis]